MIPEEKPVPGNPLESSRPAGAEPSWLTEQRSRFHPAWSAAEPPHPKDEDWKYVEVDFALEDFSPVSKPSDPLERHEFLNVLGEASGRLTMVDGIVTEVAGEEVRVEPVVEDQEGRLAPFYGAMTPPGLDIFAAANLSFGPPGAVITIPAGRYQEAPIVIDVQAVAEGSVSFPQVTLVGEAGSEASVVLLYRSTAGADLLLCPIVETRVGQGARLALTVVQNLSGEARMVGHHRYETARDADLRIGEIGLGGRFARQRQGIVLAGKGSSVRMGGIYFGDRSQVLDYRINVTHRGPRTTSDIFLKGAVAGTAQAVWTGLMRIEKEAVGTSAFETNRNLVLSDGAKINSVPNLEILTDDLQCGHGSSSGPIDEHQLYYLMSRGLPRDRAERLLVRGFFDEILSDLASPALAAPSRRRVAEKFAFSQQGGS